VAGAGAAAGAIYAHDHHDGSEYGGSYDNNIYANHPPMEAITSGGPSAIAANAMASHAMAYQQQGYQYDPSQQYQQQNYDYAYGGEGYQQPYDGQYYQGDYSQYPQDYQHQEYEQYQNVPLTPASAVPSMDLPAVAATGKGAGAGRPMNSYSQDLKNDHFLRELRE
jgi:hypothetical protein